jgi:hypothetical protein
MDARSQPHGAEDQVSGQPLSTDYLAGLSPGEREIVHESDQAFIQLHRPTWPGWKKVMAGVVVLRFLFSPYASR